MLGKGKHDQNNPRHCKEAKGKRWRNQGRGGLEGARLCSDLPRKQIYTRVSSSVILPGSLPGNVFWIRSDWSNCKADAKGQGLGARATRGKGALWAQAKPR